MPVELVGFTQIRPAEADQMAASARRGTMHKNAVSAIEALQGRALAVSRQDRGEVLEEALSDLVRSPDRDSDAEHQAGSAVARAGTKVKRRKDLVGPMIRLDAPADAPAVQLPPQQLPVVDDATKHELILVNDALERALSEQDRCLLDLTGLGFTAAEIAELESIDPARIRVRLSRARARARRAAGARA
jgi:DNA-directed RNA polymerase specialized sigma24 family protein